MRVKLGQEKVPVYEVVTSLQHVCVCFFLIKDLPQSSIGKRYEIHHTGMAR